MNLTLLIMWISMWEIFGIWREVGSCAGFGYLYMNDDKLANYFSKERLGYYGVLGFDYAGSGLYGAGFVIGSYLIGDKRMKKTSIKAMNAFVISGVVVNGMKYLAGRKRPYEDPYAFKPFSGNDSFPSGHASTAFSILSVYAMEYGKPYSYFLYSLAALSSFARIYNGAHWTTDVVAGGAIGYLVARYVFKSRDGFIIIPFIP